MVVMPVVMAQANSPQSGGDSHNGDVPLPSAAFEVASIHPDPPSPDGRGSMQVGFTPNGTFTAHGIPLKRLISMAFGVDELQVSGGPEWLSTDRYTIVAKADAATQEQLPRLAGPQERLVGQRMVQALLADRFKLTVHHESKELSILALVVAKSGSKLQASTPGDTYANGLKDRDGKGHAGMMRMGDGKITAQGISMDGLVKQLTGQMHQIVQDKTGLAGMFDFTLSWTPDHDHDSEGPGSNSSNGSPGSASARDSAGPSIFTALQEQLGLKLESQKAPVEALVIDHIERPSEN
jgi:uncharacterized protein (TIGR03435 family)